MAIRKPLLLAQLTIGVLLLNIISAKTRNGA
jgi:hypothetical protein